MTTPAANPNTEEQFVLLEGIEHGNRFFSTHTPGNDPTKSATGETWYRVIGYAATIEEAQRKLYGRSYTQNAEHQARCQASPECSCSAGS